MNMSFYTAAVGAGQQQNKLAVVGNNLANVNTVGYKTKTGVFSDLVYQNINAPANANTNLKQGSGGILERTETLFTEGSLMLTESQLDFAIQGQGFFALFDPGTQEFTYTRDGSFSLSQLGDVLYLANDQGKWVMDSQMNPIVVLDPNDELNIGIFDFENKNGMLSIGANQFLPVDKNGAPFLSENSELTRGALEGSNVDLGIEMARVIESQRAYQLSLKMIQTSDEITNTINNLRT